MMGHFPWKWDFFLELSLWPQTCPSLGWNISQRTSWQLTQTPRPCPFIEINKPHNPEFDTLEIRNWPTWSKEKDGRKDFSNSLRWWRLGASSWVTSSYGQQAMPQWRLTQDPWNEADILRLMYSWDLAKTHCSIPKLIVTNSGLLYTN